MIDVRPTRARRRWQVRPGRSQDMFKDMLETWPTLGAVEEDKNYREEVRVDKQTFDTLHQEIKVSLAAVHSAGALSCMRVAAACLLCRTSLPGTSASEMMSFLPEKKIAVILYWLATTRQSQECLVWEKAHFVLSCMRLFRCWMIPCLTEWFAGHPIVSFSRSWLTWSMSITCHAVLEPLMDLS